MGEKMKIRTVHITNFRKIIDAKINMEDSITVIAGANNSGKTSLAELFNAAFGNQKGRFRREDVPVQKCREWSEKVYPVFAAAFQSGKNQDENLNDIFSRIESAEKPEDALLIPPVALKIQVDYDENQDDIRYFADYIMEFSPDNTSFYFIYQYGINLQAFRKAVDIAYEKLSMRFQKLSGDPDKDQRTIRMIQEMLIDLYVSACEETAWFADCDYTNTVSMDVVAFKGLFHYQHIAAGRSLADESSDKMRLLSRDMIDIAEHEEHWQDLTRELPDQIVQPIQDSHIQEKVRESSIQSLNDAMDAISQTNGGQAGNIAIDMDISEDTIRSLLRNIIHAKFQTGDQTGDYYLSESSQGLGYSNLIYIHLQLLKYKKEIDPFAVNFFVIEEPESHMHPQMQNVFAQYLFQYYEKENQMQGLLTTHSHEVVRMTTIPQLRVLRQLSPFHCQLFDLHQFYDTLQAGSDKELLEFYDWFYTINFPDIVFADKIILYEGDTERMLIKSALQSDAFAALRNQYVSFVQVGGAYGYRYRFIIDFLGIKSVIITDLDYDVDATTESDILASRSTNWTINQFASSNLSNPTPTIQMLYDWKTKSNPVVISDTICLAFQGHEDGLARTLEEAMLAKRYSLTALDKQTRDKWEKRRKDDGLQFVIPRGDACNIRAIVSSTSKAKTDFMYSVILGRLAEDMLPNYIKEALLWLMQ